jgi:hypothetical protein
MGRAENSSYSEGFESPRAIVMNNIIRKVCNKDNIFYGSSRKSVGKGMGMAGTEWLQIKEKGLSGG